MVFCVASVCMSISYHNNPCGTPGVPWWILRNIQWFQLSRHRRPRPFLGLRSLRNVKTTGYKLAPKIATSCHSVCSSIISTLQFQPTSGTPKKLQLLLHTLVGPFAVVLTLLLGDQVPRGLGGSRFRSAAAGAKRWSGQVPV